MTTRPPPEGPQSLSPDELRELVTRGLVELRAVDDERLTRSWRRIADQLDEGDVASAPEGTLVGAPDDETGGAGDPATSSVPQLPASTAARAAAAPRVVAWLPLAAAAAVALVVGVGVGLAWPRGVAPATPAAVATYQLEPLAEVAAVPVNALLLEDEGVRRLEVDLSTLPTTTGYHEVWLLDPATGALASLGPVRPDNSYVVPPGTDLTTLTALDVSAEPLDGDPGHSGDSLLRGEVRWTG